MRSGASAVFRDQGTSANQYVGEEEATGASPNVDLTQTGTRTMTLLLGLKPPLQKAQVVPMDTEKPHARMLRHLRRTRIPHHLLFIRGVHPDRSKRRLLLVVQTTTQISATGKL